MAQRYKPDIICVQETWLDNSSEIFVLDGYDIISRRDRITDTFGGGVATYARRDCQHIVDLGESDQDERCYSMIHSNRGPILLINWYRAPGAGI